MPNSHRPAAHRALPLLIPVAMLIGCGTPPDTAADAEPVPGAAEVAERLQPSIQIEGESPVLWSMEERLSHHEVPAVSVAVLEDGKLLWAQAWGVADTETGREATATTLFQAASMSKPVAALTALTLVDEGVVELDAPVNRYLTSWQLPDNQFTADSAVTLRGLMTHSAGTTVWGFPGYRKDEPFAAGQPLATNAEVLDGLGNTDSVRVFKVPGTSMRYSGGGYTILEQLVEDVTGLPFPEAAAARVLGPAGLTRSTYAQPLPDNRWAEAARGHSGDGSEVEGEWHTYPEQAAAGLWTTPTELAELSIHLLGILEGDSTGIMSPAMLQAAMTPHHAGDPAFENWGLGFALSGSGDTVRFGHGGANEGFRSDWVVYRGTGNGAVVMTNGDRGSALAQEVLRALADAYAWPDFQPEVRAVRAMDADALGGFAGAYTVEGQTGPDGEPVVVEVVAGDGVLNASVPRQGTSTLYPAADEAERFFDAEDGTVIQFERDGDGNVVAAQQRNGPRLVRVGAPG